MHDAADGTCGRDVTYPSSQTHAATCLPHSAWQAFHGRSVTIFVLSPHDKKSLWASRKQKAIFGLKKIVFAQPGASRKQKMIFGLKKTFLLSLGPPESKKRFLSSKNRFCFAWGLPKAKNVFALPGASRRQKAIVVQLKVPRTAPSLKPQRTQNPKADSKAHTFFTGLLGKVALS